MNYHLLATSNQTGLDSQLVSEYSAAKSDEITDAEDEKRRNIHIFCCQLKKSENP